MQKSLKPFIYIYSQNPAVLSSQRSSQPRLPDGSSKLMIGEIGFPTSSKTPTGDSDISTSSRASVSMNAIWLAGLTVAVTSDSGLTFLASANSTVALQSQVRTPGALLPASSTAGEGAWACPQGSKLSMMAGVSHVAVTSSSICTCWMGRMGFGARIFMREVTRVPALESYAKMWDMGGWRFCS